MQLGCGSERGFRRTVAHSTSARVAVEIYYEPLSPFEGKKTFALRIIGEEESDELLKKLWHLLSEMIHYPGSHVPHVAGNPEMDRLRRHMGQTELVIRHIPEVGAIAFS